MKLRARWEGELPQLGQVLKTPGPRARCAYVITGITAHQPPRVTLEVERITISELRQMDPDTIVWDWRWDKRDRRPR